MCINTIVLILSVVMMLLTYTGICKPFIQLIGWLLVFVYSYLYRE